ncbi:SRPBCC domain-containing protein [Phenylobacterium sp. J367]|uniref:SRPBCC domain-containing protein n=1 Tax=Phenylobacterium sp. J367 TaxID=2898435 RepID=UPI00215135AF|nr:SRPBCC domain-containing protein [Phenylobacterium sp. J367]MCR5877667.1 SRPBCC domain-containing protein [Phenylobacterium sp. J367]
MFGTRGPQAGPQPTGVVKPPKPKGPGGIRIEHRIGIQAPAEVIWEAVYDLDRWHEWNPLYPKASGRIGIGQVLDLTLVIPGQPERQIQPVVLEWVPHEQLHWKLTQMGGLVKAIRYIEIDALSETGCIVSNGELFQGLLAKTALRGMGRSVFRGFAAMNEALKERAEAVWQARRQG